MSRKIIFEVCPEPPPTTDTCQFCIVACKWREKVSRKDDYILQMVDQEEVRVILDDGGGTASGQSLAKTQEIHFVRKK